MHGYGIENIKSIIEKYNGILEINHTNTDFSVLIVVKVV